MTYLKVYTDLGELLEPLNHEEKGRLFEAMLRYAQDGSEPELDGNERFIWPVVRRAIDREAAAYESKAEANRENGRKGAAARWSKAKDSDRHERHSEAMAGDSENAQEKEKEKEQEQEQEKEQEQEQEKEQDQEYVCMPKENAPSPARADTHIPERAKGESDGSPFEQIPIEALGGIEVQGAVLLHKGPDLGDVVGPARGGEGNAPGPGHVVPGLEIVHHQQILGP